METCPECNQVNCDCPGEFDDNYYARCPKCGVLRTCIDDEPEIEEGGEYKATCVCDEVFTVRINVSISFTSPERTN